MHQGEGKRQRKSIGIQNSIGQDFMDANRRGIRRRTDSDSKRLNKARAYRNLLGNTISVVSHEEESQVFLVEKNGSLLSRGTQTTFHRSVDFPTTSSAEIQSRQAAILPLLPAVYRGTSLPERYQTRGYNVANDENLSGVVRLRESHGSENVEEPLALFDGGEESSIYGTESSFNFILDPTEQARVSRRSNQIVLTREDYQSYDTQNATGRQEVISETTRDTNFTRYRCCGIKRSSPSISTRPVPIFIEETLTKREPSITCRICHEGNEIEPLIQPCLCKGTVANVHAKCLKNWLEQSSTSRCELCNYPYAIRQTRKYTKSISVKVFFTVVISRKSLAYDLVSFFVITPLAFAGIAVCAQASLRSPQPENAVQIANITKAGMIMLCAVIVIAYCIWLLMMLTSYYKLWKKWYNNCFDVEVIPVRMTSEDRREASVRFLREREVTSREQVPRILSTFQAPVAPNSNYSSNRHYPLFRSNQRRLTNMAGLRNAPS